MQRNELASWIQVGLGIVGLFLAIKGGAPVFGEAATSDGAALPPQAIASLVGFAFILVFSAGLTTVGAGFLLVAVFKRLGAKLAHHAAFAFILSLLALTATFVLVLLDSSFWGVTLAVAGMSLVGTLIAANTKDTADFWFPMLFGTFVCVMMGSLFANILSKPEPGPIPPVSAPTE